MRLRVPHGHVFVIGRDALARIVGPEELGLEELPETTILVARPDVPESAHAGAVWRAAFHGHVHAELDLRVKSGALGDAEIRARIDRIGQTEFDEIRAVLAGEELLFSEKDDREAYIEFVAFYLELRHFAEDDREKFFPTLHDVRRVEETLALDVDGELLLARCRPEGARAPSRRPSSGESPTESPESGGPGSDGSPSERISSAEEARGRGNLARAALLQLQASPDQARPRALADLAALGNRLHAALDARGASEDAPTAQGWQRVLTSLAEAAARSRSPRGPEARVLLDLQKACVESERERRTVDVITWLSSLFQRPVVRSLPMARVVRVARRVHRAFELSHRARLERQDRRALEEVFHAAVARSRANAKRALGPVLEGVLDEVGLRPASVPEEVARAKLCAEILDTILERGFLGLGQLRDALSRSNIKMSNLTAAELARGDALLLADARLALRLDGVYRRGEIYLRFLQKLSSVFFGTSTGRFVTMHLVLPVLVSFVLLEGLQHLAHPIGNKLGHGNVHLRTTASTALLALFFYGVIHSQAVRGASLGLLRAAGRLLHGLFIGLPCWFLARPWILGILRSESFSLFTRLIVKPLLLGAPAFLLARRQGLGVAPSVLASCGLFLAAALFFGAPLGRRVEESATYLLALGLGNLRRHVIPGLIALVLDIFRRAVERVERGIYTVDEWLTFREGQGTLSLVVRGALGALWFFLTYLLRIYVNLLIEPQVNPIKHFPVVTVSHKIILPFGKTLLEALRTPLMPLGPVAANGIAGTTVFLLPGVFGFLVWELKENWRLYAQNRASSLVPVRIGHHGETMNGLLVVGFHSGTLPKLFAKLRLAARHGRSSVNAHRQAIHEVEHALVTFFERELSGLLRGAPRWTAGPVSVHAVLVGSNRIRVGLACGEGGIAWLHFEEQSGWLIAGVAGAGFLDALAPDQRSTMETALAGLYKLSAVDLVREQVEALIGEGTRYDIADEGLVVWSGEGFTTEAVYDLRGHGELAPRVRGAKPDSPHRPLDVARLMFAHQPIPWSSWVLAFASGSGHAPVFSGPPLLPAVGRPPRA